MEWVTLMKLDFKRYLMAVLFAVMPVIILMTSLFTQESFLFSLLSRQAYWLDVFIFTVFLPGVFVVFSWFCASVSITLFFSTRFAFSPIIVFRFIFSR